jgi:hypothetical protein
VKSTVRWVGQAKALTAWRRGSLWGAREMGSSFSQSEVGHCEIVGPRRTPEWTLDRSVMLCDVRVRPFDFTARRT